MTIGWAKDVPAAMLLCSSLVPKWCVGMMKIPVTWADYQQKEYVVYAKGNLEMGGFVNLMERVEYIGKEIVYKDEDGILIS